MGLRSGCDAARSRTTAAGISSVTAIGSTSQKRAARSGLVEDPAGERRPGVAVVVEEPDELDDARLAVGRSASAEASRTATTLRSSSAAACRPARVVEIGPAAGHPRPEVGADGTEHDDGPAGHVFAAVRADPLDDGLGAAVADREAHPRPTDEVQAQAWSPREDRRTTAEQRATQRAAIEERLRAGTFQVFAEHADRGRCDGPNREGEWLASLRPN